MVLRLALVKGRPASFGPVAARVRPDRTRAAPPAAGSCPVDAAVPSLRLGLRNNPLTPRGLYRAVLEHERSALAEAWGPSLQRAEEMEPLDGVRMVLGGLFDLMVERPQLVALLVHEWLSASVFSLPSTRQLPARFRAIYERGRRQGVFVAETDFEVVYGTVLAALVGQAVFLPWYFETTVPGSDRSELREHVLDQLMHNITGRRSSGSTPPPRSRARREEDSQ